MTLETHEDFMSKYAREKAEREVKAKEYILSLVPKLKEISYRWLVVCFDGAGDSGQIEKTFMSNEDAAQDVSYAGEMTGEAVPEGFAPELEDAAWSLTPDGFEINEGGYGAIVLDTETGTIKVNYSYRVEESIRQDYEV